MTDHVFTVNPAFVDQSQPSRLTPTLYLSGAAFAAQHERMRALGITAVVNLTDEDFGHANAGFHELRLNLQDAEEVPGGAISTFLMMMTSWASTDEVVLIHCHGGISRTAAFAIAWRMCQRGCTADSDLRYEWSRAEDEVGAVRPIIMPHYLLKRSVLQYFETVRP